MKVFVFCINCTLSSFVVMKLEAFQVKYRGTEFMVCSAGSDFLDLRSIWGSLNLCNQRWWRTSKKLWIHVPSSLPVLPYAQTALLRLQLAKFLEMTAVFCCANGMSYGKLHWNRKVNKPCPVSRYIPHLFLTSFPCWNNHQTSENPADETEHKRLDTQVRRGTSEEEDDERRHGAAWCWRNQK